MIDLKKDIHFITAQDILNEVKNDLRVYFERNVVDDSHLYPVIRECLSKMGSKIYPVNNTVIYIENYQGKLPDDFYKLVLAIGCFEYVVQSTPNTNPQLYDVSEPQLEDFLISKPSETCLDECGENFYVIQRFETFDVKFTDFIPLSISNSSIPYCSNNCFNPIGMSQNQIDITNKKISTGFPQGFIYIDYLQKLESEDVDGKDLLIPDFARIREWIKAACVKKIFQVIYWNNEADVQQRYIDSKNELSVLEQNARSFIKQIDFKELYDTRKVFYGRYDKFQQVVYGLPPRITRTNRVRY